MADSQRFHWRSAPGPRDEAWGLYLLAGSSGEVPEPPTGPGWSLLVLVRGAGSLALPGRRKLRLEAGEVALLEAGAARFTPDPDRNCRLHQVQFAGEVAARWMAPGLLGPLPRVLRTGFDEALLALLARLLEPARGGAGEDGRLQAGILAHLLARLEHAARRGQGNSAQRRLAEQAGRLLAEPGREEAPLESVAEELGVSYSWFRRCFRRQTGSAPQRYRARLRLDRACQLLADTTLPVKAIADRLAFSSQAYFARWFRKATGLSPSVWRARRP